MESRRHLCVPLSTAERTFLMHRLGDAESATDAILYGSEPHRITARWRRPRLLNRIRQHHLALSSGVTFEIADAMDEDILVEAIEGSRYFMDMQDDDPRCSMEAVRRIDSLRMQVQRTLHRRILAVELGGSRVRGGLRSDSFMAPRQGSLMPDSIGRRLP